MRKLKNRTLSVGNVVSDADRLMTRDFGGIRTHDSGHADSPTWIYTFPSHGHAQLALCVNKKKLSVYVRSAPPGRAGFDATLAACGDIEERYGPGLDKNPANSLLSEEIAPYLTPRRWPLVRVRVDEGKLPALVADYLGVQSPAETTLSSTANDNSEAESDSTGCGRQMVTPEMLRLGLDRNDATGRAGERLAYAEEVARLGALGCPDPAGHVCIIADVDVAAGYDVHSQWDGEVRCIEVKSTSGGSGDFFLTANERAVLANLAEQAWLYRVRIDDAGESGCGEVIQRLQNPIAKLPDEVLQAVVWRVDGAMASQCGDDQL